MIKRPSTAQSDQSPTRLLVTLQCSANKRLLTSFPKDSFADITIQCKHKRFELQKAHLRLETNYFEQNANIVAINEVDPDVLENILRCFYGGQYQIAKHSEVYQAYQVAFLLKSEALCKQLENSIHVCKQNFTLVYQLAELYNLEDLRQQCFEYLENTPEAFRLLFDIGMLQLKKQHKKSTPSDVLSLNEQCFRSLVEAHNLYRKNDPNRYLSNVELYEVLKLYGHGDEKLKQLVVTLIDREKLSCEEYEVIYHQMALKEHVEIFQEPAIQKCHASVKEYKHQLIPSKEVQKYFDYEQSENYFNKKKVRELSLMNSGLVGENQQLKMSLETILKSTSNIKESLQETILQQIDMRVMDKEREIERLRQELQDVRMELMMKNTALIKMSQTQDDTFNDRDCEDMSQYGMVDTTQQVQDEMQESYCDVMQSQVMQSQVMSEIQIIKPMQSTMNQSLLSVTTTKRYQPDVDPVTLDSQSQLNYLFDHLGASIFQQVNLKSIYWGSRDGCDIVNFQASCDGYNDVLILIKSFDYNQQFGIFIKGEFQPGQINTNVLLLLINSQQIITLNEIILCQDNLIEVENLIIKDECGSHCDNVGTAQIAGAKKFQVDEIEAYAVFISNEM